MRCRTQRRDGCGAASPTAAFTLIELLVVIAIIAILAAILFPVFAQAREKARQAACLNNTKQLALGVMQYNQDYDELLPVAGYNAQCRGRWQWQIYPYVKNEQVFTCPNLSSYAWSPRVGLGSPPAPCPAQPQVGTHDKGGYGWNYALQADATGTTLDRAPGYALSRIAKPADTIIIGDTGLDLNHNAASGWAMLAADPRKNFIVGFNQPGLYPQFRHNTTQSRSLTAQGQNVRVPIDGRSNFVFLDGHAKSLSIGQAMQSGQVVNGNPTEDGATLVRETIPNHTSNNIEYVLWNIF